jgi:hypothetical protein
MDTHVTAIERLLEPLGYPTFYVDVPDAPPRAYLLTWSSNGIPWDTERTNAAPEDLTDLLGITHVADTARGVLQLRQRVRAVLNDARPTVPGRFVELHLFDSQRTQVDRDVAPHVPYGVDIYRLTSDPA